MHAPEEKTDDGLTPQHDAAILALLTEPTQEKAAAKVGVHPGTLRRWLKLPSFRSAFRAARAEAFDEMVTGLHRLSHKALEALERNLVCGEPSVETRVALGIIDQAQKTA